VARVSPFSHYMGAIAGRGNVKGQAESHALEEIGSQIAPANKVRCPPIQRGYEQHQR
jgi:hypothetical protein